MRILHVILLSDFDGCTRIYGNEWIMLIIFYGGRNLINT